MSLEAVVEEIREEAEAEAEQIREAAEERAEREAAGEREQAASSAKLEAKQRRLEARRDVLADVRGAVEEALVALEGDDRQELTAALLASAAEQFEEGPVRVYGRGDDAALIEELLEEYDGFEYAGEHDCLGGVVCESDASRVRVNNTFDSTLETVWDEQLREVSHILFEEE